MKKNLGKSSFIFILVYLMIGGLFYAFNTGKPVSQSLPTPRMNSDLVGFYNYADDSKISLTFGFDEKEEFHYVDDINNIEDIGTFVKVKEGVYSLKESLIEKQEIAVNEDFSFDIKINGKDMIFWKESQDPTWITVHK